MRCYVLWKFLSDERDELLGVYSTEEAALAELGRCPDDDEHEYQVEEWPIDRLGGRLLIRVVGSR